MSACTTYFANQILNALLRGGTISGINAHFACLRSNPTDAGTLTSEMSGASNYARVAATNLFATAAAANQIANSTEVSFPNASNYWGFVEFIAVVDTSTRFTGNVLWYSTLSPTNYKEVGTGTRLRFDPAQLSLSLT